MRAVGSSQARASGRASFNPWAFERRMPQSRSWSAGSVAVVAAGRAAAAGAGWTAGAQPPSGEAAETVNEAVAQSSEIARIFKRVAAKICSLVTIPQALSNERYTWSPAMTTELSAREFERRYKTLLSKASLERGNDACVECQRCKACNGCTFCTDSERLVRCTSVCAAACVRVAAWPRLTRADRLPTLHRLRSLLTELVPGAFGFAHRLPVLLRLRRPVGARLSRAEPSLRSQDVFQAHRAPEQGAFVVKTPDPALEALWKNVLDHWTTTQLTTHSWITARATRRSTKLPCANRGMKGDRERGAGAEKRLTAVLMLAMSKLEVSRAEPKAASSAATKLVLILFFLLGSLWCCAI